MHTQRMQAMLPRYMRPRRLHASSACRGTVQAEVQLQSFKQLAAREQPGIAARLASVQARLAAQKERERELQQEYKDLKTTAAELGIGAVPQALIVA